MIPQEELSYKDSVNRTTGKSPFEIVYGLHPRGVCELRELKDQKAVNGHVDDFSQSMKEIHENT